MQILGTLRNRINDLLANKIEPVEKPRSLYEPIEYVMSMGGKRMRPTLCLMACELFGNNVKDALNLALAIEYFHNFTLVHDDVMDAANLRRGQPTMHQKYSLSTAILSGDMMMIKAYEYLAKIKPKYLPEILPLFNQTAREVCEGQQYDMDYEAVNSISLQEYLRMIELKTAVLLAASMAMGAMVCDASSENVYNLYEFGRNIGIAFQLQDDILDTYGNAATFGKRVGGDILRNKKTILLVTALELAKDNLATQLHTHLQLPITTQKEEEEKIAAVKDIYQQLGIQKLAQARLDEYYKRAFEYLAAITISKDKKQPLIDYVNTLANRRE